MNRIKKYVKAALKPDYYAHMNRMRMLIREEIALSAQNKAAASPPVKSHATNRLELFETATGNYWLPADAVGDIIAQDIKANKIFDEVILHTARRFMRPNTICLDIGSNFGQMAILMSKYMDEISNEDTHKIHAFEAEPFVYQILLKNIKENNARVIPHHGAVYSKSGEILYFPEIDFVEHQTYGSYGLDFSRENKNGRAVPTLKIDDITFDLPISFMKIDTQGMDLFVMQGARQTIMQNKMPIVFEYESCFEDRQKMCFQEYVEFIDSINYIFYKVPQPNNFLILPRKNRKNNNDCLL